MSWLLQTVLWWTLGSTCLFRFWFLQCVCPAVGLLGCMGGLFPVFYGISTLFSIVAVLVCIPTNSEVGSLFSTPSPAFIIYRLLDCSHSDQCEMVPHSGFDLHLSDNECTTMFIAALFAIARTWKQPRCPSADEWIRKLWYIHTMKYYSAIKKNAFETVLMR